MHSLKVSSKTIAKEYSVAENIFSKGFGLMFRTKVNKPLIFPFKEEKIISLHMLFVFTSIDILYIDKNKKIVEIKENFKPFTFYTPKNKSKYVIELAQGTVKNNSIKVGQVVSF